MVVTDVHEVTQLQARNAHLEREHARLMLVVSEQADMIAFLRASIVAGGRGSVVSSV
jgi:hypothetical protein